MRILDRMGLLIRADVHGVMDQLEERSLLIKQHLREAELEVSRKRARVEAMEEEARALAGQLERSRASLSGLEADVDLALAEGREALARFTLRRLLPEREATNALAARTLRLETERARLAERLAEQEAELDALRTRVRGRLAELQAEDAPAAVAPRAIADEEIELELLRRQRAEVARERQREEVQR